MTLCASCKRVSPSYKQCPSFQIFNEKHVCLYEIITLLGKNIQLYVENLLLQNFVQLLAFFEKWMLIKIMMLTDFFWFLVTKTPIFYTSFPVIAHHPSNGPVMQACFNVVLIKDFHLNLHVIILGFKHEIIAAKLFYF